ncbi:MAG TPA: S53 family peptidase [Acidimicrobiales bacterium]|nr:S53 family peptidase [Acidimicrobiales bacterium]
MKKNRWVSPRALAAGVVSTLAVALVAPSLAQGAGAATPTVLSADVPHLQGATALGAAPAAQRLDIVVLMRGQDPAGLSSLLARQAAHQAGPLTPGLFDQRFGVTAAQGAAVRSWLHSGGIEVPADQPLQSRSLFAVGTVGAVGSLLHTGFGRYRGPDGTDFVANLSAPTVPAGLGIVFVGGLNTSVRFKPALSIPPSPPTPPSGVPTSINTSAPDLWKLYNQPAANTGQGQQLATLLWGSKAEFDPTVPNDLLAFENSFTPALPHVPLSFVWQDNYVDPGASSDTLGSGLVESDIDVEASTGMAPGVSAITLYEAQDSLAADLDNVLAKWVNNPAGALQMSASFGGCETLDMALEGNAFDALFQQAEAEGRTVFVSTGDSGAGCALVVNTGANSPIIDAEYPSTSPYVVAVGGTVITEKAHNSSFSEYAWSGTGGGSSKYEAAPTWQTTSGPPALEPCVTNTDFMNWEANGSQPSVPPSPVPSTTCRAVPDVAAQSGDLLSGYDIINNGAASTGAGTSLAAPLWQGMWARVQAAAPAGDSTGLGYAAPLLYKQGANATAYARDFFDITVGDNGPYPATPGWDFVSGWGSPNVTNLATDLDGTTTPSCGTSCPVVGGTSGGTSGGGTGGTGGGVTNSCPAGANQISGTQGHATQIAGVVDDGQPALSQDDLDILAGNLSWNYTTSVLTATIKVQNLSATPPNGLPTDEYFRYEFSIDGGSYYLEAARDPSGTTFQVVSSGVTGATGPATGTFDTTDNTVTINVPAASLAAAGGPTLASGDVLTGMTILAQRWLGVLTLTADSESASCSYVLPSAPTTSTSGGGKGAKGKGKGKG